MEVGKNTPRRSFGGERLWKKAAKQLPREVSEVTERCGGPQNFSPEKFLRSQKDACGLVLQPSTIEFVCNLAKLLQVSNFEASTGVFLRPQKLLWGVVLRPSTGVLSVTFEIAYHLSIACSKLVQTSIKLSMSLNYCIAALPITLFPVRLLDETQFLASACQSALRDCRQSTFLLPHA